MFLRLLLVILSTLPIVTYAQQKATMVVQVRSEEGPVSGATVTVNSQSFLTDENGKVTATVLAGNVNLRVTAKGYLPAAETIAVVSGQSQEVLVELERSVHEEEIVVSATRTDARLDDSPTRVEVLGREEIEGKMLMTPGDIVMMLNEMGGMRVQTTSPSLGAASVRIQGMRGRYTRFLSDGLPLFGQQVGGLGLLQIPPMDLAQVEVIKGTASALYGAGAMGGVVNLVSRRPGKEASREFLLNQSTRGGTDTVFFGSTPINKNWSTSLLAGGHFQRRADVDDDGWADLAGYQRGVLRPRFFWDNGAGKSLFLTVGGTYESRSGGTMNDGIVTPIGARFREDLDTKSFDFGGVGNVVFGRDLLFTTRFAAGQRWHNHLFGDVRERDRHANVFAETTLRKSMGRHVVVGGVAFESDSFHPTEVPLFAYTYTVPGVFVQDDFQLAEWVSVSAGARADFHSQYGTFFSPRLSALLKQGPWSVRASAGQGFFAPTPLTEETEAAGLTRLVIPAPLKAERGRSASLDLTRRAGPVSVTATLFGSRIRNAVEVERELGYFLFNSTGATTNIGVELLGTYRLSPFAVTASYTYVRSREYEAGRRVDVPLTPRHSAGVVAMWESEETGRVGVEVYYTGKQRLEANSYRDISRPYVIAGFLAERRFGPARLFINAENLTGVRQTRWDPLLRPTRAPDGRWTVDAWAPLDGRTFNGGIRFQF
ncbi:MAG TPA: TonB-dependent receptor [Terriglobales bacterium]|nr:TonB-dependent receptor [Terriglobales bacterium]